MREFRDLCGFQNTEFHKCMEISIIWTTEGEASVKRIIELCTTSRFIFQATTDNAPYVLICQVRILTEFI